MKPSWFEEDGLDASGSSKAAELLQEAGVVVARQVLEKEDVEMVLEVFKKRMNKVEKALATKGKLDAETFEFQECSGRGELRFDIRFEWNELEDALMHRIIEAMYNAIAGAQVLQEEEARVIAQGVVVAKPNAQIQRWHRDGPSLFPETGFNAMPAHAITCFLALSQSGNLEGTTQFLPGSHIGSEDKYIEPIRLPYAEPQLVSGDIVAFDYRLIHRGGRNISNMIRPLFYCVFARHWFIDTRNYSTQPRSLDNSSKIIKQHSILCLETDAHYSENALHIAPSGMLPKPLQEDEILKISSPPLRFGDLHGQIALRALEKAAGFSYLSTIAFLRSCDLRDRNLLQIAPAPSANELGFAQLLDQRYVAQVAVERIPKIDGFGLFVDADIPAESFLCEYAGLVRPHDTAHSWDGYSLHYADCLDGSLPLNLSARYTGSLARFANHDDTNPNTKFVHCVSDSGLLRIVLVTSRRLTKGEQVLVDYGKAYWQAAALYCDKAKIPLSTTSSPICKKKEFTISGLKSTAMLRLAGIAASVRLAVDDVLLHTTDDDEESKHDNDIGEIIMQQRIEDEEDAVAAWRDLDTW